MGFVPLQVGPAVVSGSVTLGSGPDDDLRFTRLQPTMTTITYTVREMSCSHCEAAVKTEVSAVAGVASVVVDLRSKRVEVTGSELDDAAIRAAIDEAGYEAE